VAACWRRSSTLRTAGPHTIVSGVVEGNTSKVILNGPGLHPASGEKPGAFEISLADDPVVVEREGFGVTVGPTGITSPAPMPDVLNQISGALGSTGGNPNPTGGNVGDDSGHNTAQGGTYGGESQNLGGTTQILNNTINQANQDAANSLMDGVSQWEQIIAGIPTGQASYLATGRFDQFVMNGASNPCGSTCVGTWNFQADVDFAVRTVNVGYSMQSTGGGGNIVDNGSQGFSYGTLTGPAQWAVPSNSGNGVATFQFLNQGGKPAAAILGSSSYSDNLSGGNKGTGAIMAAPKGPFQGG
jgi:hypothetical protein